MSNFKINVCETQKQKGGGDFSPDNIANYKTLIRRFFADYGTEALFEQNKKLQQTDNVLYYHGCCSFLFCEFGESGISSEQKIKALRFCYERNVARKMSRYPLASSVKQFQKSKFLKPKVEYIGTICIKNTYIRKSRQNCV